MDVDVVVVGAGAVGLAAAAALAATGRSTVVLEREAGIARGVTSRNSEVIHAGLYYPPGSFKARLCVEGRERLYARCRRLGIGYRRTGKLVVATAAEEVAVLEALLARGRENGAPGLELVDAAAVTRLEPHVRAVAGLLSPSTGIVDAHALCLSYQAELEAAGGSVVLGARVEAVQPRAGGYRVHAREADGSATAVTAAAVVNAAGLAADRVAALAGIDPDARGYRIHPCKGDYFALAASAPLAFSRLVYPVPAGAGLGVHVTLDLGGRVRLGPDAEYVATPRYEVKPEKAERFAAAVRRYVPALEVSWLAPDFAGVRPRLARPGEPFRDFVVAEESAAGLPGFVNLVGIESPGLTAAPAIAARVVDLLN